MELKIAFPFPRNIQTQTCKISAGNFVGASNGHVTLAIVWGSGLALIYADVEVYVVGEEPQTTLGKCLLDPGFEMKRTPLAAAILDGFCVSREGISNRSCAIPKRGFR